jgi:protein SCO1
MSRPLVFVALTSALLLCACSESQPEPQDTGARVAVRSDERPAAQPTGKSTPACCEAIEPAGVLPDLSVYQLESGWRSQEGKLIKLSHFHGRPTVVAMVFTTCEYACPRTLADLKAIEAALTDADRSRVRFVLVSFDTVHDKPAVLRAYAKENDLDVSRWTLLTGSEGDVRELAAVLGVKYKRSKAVGFSHSNLISVLDTVGRVVHQQKGIGVPSAQTVEVIAGTH